MASSTQVGPVAHAEMKISTLPASLKAVNKVSGKSHHYMCTSSIFRYSYVVRLFSMFAYCVPRFDGTAAALERLHS
jgi:hypothetical protein